ncbi:DUF5319 family protein [Glycomyces xiaoerkulensis]|uniref:DUF5319 family protein n=1 Tax=Glycomyces xiaoerkulensis TaxID=2038139 RepID=UPI000C25E689|nr:DUF5319 family protein [Glycomyces xiaoerkulensis]
MHEEPRDPFADDPEHMDHSMVFEPELDDADRADLLEDLHELEMFEKVLQPLGFRGVVVDCADCDEPHYFTWGLLMSNLRALLKDNSAQVHEPAYDPDPAQYVTWDYARGYSDCWLRHHGSAN